MIRHKLFICFSLLMLSVSQQILANAEVDRIYAFQVLAAEDARNELSEFPLKTLAYLQEDASIQLGPSGYLLLVHHTGKLLEFEGEQVISIAERAGLINKQLGLSTQSIKPIGYDWLFGDKMNQISKSAVGAVTCRPIDHLKLDKFQGQMTLSKSDPVVCTRYEIINEIQEPVTCQVINIFDEVLSQSVVRDGYLVVDFREIRYDIDLYIVKLKDAADNTIVHGIGIKLDKETDYIPRDCDFDTPLKALEMAIYTEKMKIEDQCPLRYYQLASALSDRPIYQKLLAEAEKRLRCE